MRKIVIEISCLFPFIDFQNKCTHYPDQDLHRVATLDHIWCVYLQCSQKKPHIFETENSVNNWAFSIMSWVNSYPMDKIKFPVAASK